MLTGKDLDTCTIRCWSRTNRASYNRQSSAILMLTVLGLIAFFLPVAYLISEGFQESDSQNKELDHIRARHEEKESEKVLEVINSTRDVPLFIGDVVLVANTPATREIGAAGMHGTILRAATPSTSEIEPVGTRFSDAAVNIFVDELEKPYWFYADMVSKVFDRGEAEYANL